MIFRSRGLLNLASLRPAASDIRPRASKQYAIFGQNPRHPSLQLKPVGEFWSARVNDAYRALAVREGNIFTWFWIGAHDEYERMLNG